MRKGRIGAILGASAVFGGLLIWDWLRYAADNPTSAPWYMGLRFGFSALVAALFLAVGALVWAYAFQRQVAAVLFALSLAVMATYAVQTGAGAGDAVLSAVSTASSAFALALLSILLLIFPVNYLSRIPPAAHLEEGTPTWPAWRWRVLRVYVAGLSLCALLAGASAIPLHLVGRPPLPWLYAVVLGYAIVLILVILGTIAYSFKWSPFPQVRRQMRFLFWSILLGFLFFLVFTLAPELLHSLFATHLLSVDASISTLTVGLIAPAFGYTILRYQLLRFDRYVRGVVGFEVGVIGLAVIGWLAFIAGLGLLPINVELGLLGAVTLMGVAGSFFWTKRQLIADHLFFPELGRAAHLLPKIPSKPSSEQLGRLLTNAAGTALSGQAVLVLLVDIDGHLQPAPPLETEHDSARRQLLAALYAGKPGTGRGWIAADDPLLVPLAHGNPRYLSELGRALATRFVKTDMPDDDLLLVPFCAQEQLIGLLVIGQLGKQYQYAGPDLGAIELLLARYSSSVENAYLYAQDEFLQRVLSRLYANSLAHDFPSLHEAALAYAGLAAETLRVGVQIWLLDEGESEHAGASLRRSVRIPLSEDLVVADTLQPAHLAMHQPLFFDGKDEQWVEFPPYLSGKPAFPFAWIPLRSGGRSVGLLILTYDRPHHFGQKEKYLLQSFAEQCATTLESTRAALQVRRAYERQQELDHLKDQFMMTASHELRTPLTAVSGYIDLLSGHLPSLTAETVADFIAKACRACEELSLMLDNIMDASRLPSEGDQLQLSEVPLAATVTSVLEMLGAGISKQQRAVRVNIPPEVLVLADEQRLRQVLLNLISNALKYSPPGSALELDSVCDGQTVTVRLRDWGPGIAPADQASLFQRFARLERDMNSKERGSGLGLYICRQLVEAMGGRIWVQSEGRPGAGSLFCFTLPAVVHEQTIADAQQSTPGFC